MPIKTIKSLNSIDVENDSSLLKGSSSDLQQLLNKQVIEVDNSDANSNKFLTKSSTNFYVKCAFVIVPISIAIIGMTYFRSSIKDIVKSL